MNKSELFDSSIAQEERIIGINIQQQPKEQPRYKLRFATIAEIKNYQRLANIRNLKLVETCPAFFNEGDLQPHQRHFVATNNEQYFLNGLNKEETADVIAKRQKRWEVLIDTSNIQQQSILKIQLSNFKRIRTFALETRQSQGSKAIGYRYTFNKVESSLVVRVWLQLDGAFKVWKEMELPVSQSNITIEIHQVNNEQTDVRINDYLFHLLLKMPYYRQAHFWLIHEDAAEIQTLELKTFRQQKYYEDTETNCSNECQLI